MSTRRPKGVTAVAIFLSIAGLYVLVSGIMESLMILTRNPLLPPTDSSPFARLFPSDSFFYISAVSLVIIGSASVMLAFGIVKRKSWAHKGSFVLLAFVIAFAAYATVGTEDRLLLGVVMGLRALIFYYMLRPNVRAYFGNSTAKAAPNMS